MDPLDPSRDKGGGGGQPPCVVFASGDPSLLSDCKADAFYETVPTRSESPLIPSFGTRDRTGHEKEGRVMHARDVLLATLLPVGR